MAKANTTFLLGTLCSDVDFRILPNSSVSYAKYQIAVQRDKGRNQTDYPYVCSFGKQAESDAKHLRKGSQCLVRGRIQTREFDQPLTCPACDHEYKKPSVATEIAAENVEYLNNCIFDEKEVAEMLAHVESVKNHTPRKDPKQEVPIGDLNDAPKINRKGKQTAAVKPTSEPVETPTVLAITEQEPEQFNTQQEQRSTPQKQYTSQEQYSQPQDNYVSQAEPQYFEPQHQEQQQDYPEQQYQEQVQPNNIFTNETNGLSGRMNQGLFDANFQAQPEFTQISHYTQSEPEFITPYEVPQYQIPNNEKQPPQDTGWSWTPDQSFGQQTTQPSNQNDILNNYR